MPQDIRQKGLTPLRGVNRRQEATSDDAALLQLRNRVRHGQSVTPLSYEGVAEPYHYEPGSVESKFGESGYDAWTGTPIGSEESLQEQRHDNQSSWSVLGNGLVKMLETTGSTVAATLLGLPVGLYTSATEGRWSGIWDNPVMGALSQFDSYMQDNYKNYLDLQQQQNAENGAWWKNLGSFASVTDQVSSLAGFVLGAAATGGGVGSVLGKLSTLIKAGTSAAKIAPVAAYGISALVSASGEAAIEANNNTRDWKELQYQKLEDSLNELYANDERVQAIQQKYQDAALQLQQRAQSDPANASYYQQQAKQLEESMMHELSSIDAEKEQRRQAGRAQIDEDARSAGNRIMAANQVLLTVGNLLTLGKIFKKSYRSAAEYENLLNSESAQGLIKNQTKGMTTAERAAAASKGEAYTTRSAKEQIFRDWVIPPLSEGSEEMNQRFISSAAGAYYDRSDANDYWKAKLDPESIQDVVDGSHQVGTALSKGFSDSWGNPAAYEEFFYGALMGAGSAALSSGFGTKTMDEVREAERATKALNDMIGAEGYFQRLAQLGVAARYYEGQKEDALKNGDMKAWKDADDKEMAHIVETYYRAGKLGDLKKDIEDAGGELTDEDVQSIIDSVNLNPEQTKDVKAKPLRDEAGKLADEVNELQKQLAELTGTAERQTPEQQPQQPQAPAQPVAQPQQRADNVSDLDNAARGGLRNVDTNAQPSGHTDLFSEVEDAEAEKAANIARIQQKIAEKKARIEEINNQINGIRGTVSGAFTTNGIVDDVATARGKIQHNKEELLKKIDDYADSINTVRYMTKGSLNDETEDELFYLHFLGKAARRRIRKIAESWDESRLPNRLHILWDTEKDGSLDDLRKKLGVGNEVGITKDEHTPEGSVTLDLSNLKESNPVGYAQVVHDAFLGGFYRMKDKDDVDASMEQQMFAAKQLKDYGQSRGLDGNEMFSKMQQDAKDVSDLFRDASNYDAAYLEAMINPDKARKRAKKAKNKVKKKAKEKQEADAWDKATFDDWNSGKLDGIEPKTESQKRKQRAFEKRAGAKRDAKKVLGNIPLPDKEKSDIGKILDAVFDRAVDEDGNIDMGKIKKFLQDPEDAIRALFEQDDALLTSIIDQHNWDNEELIKGVIKNLSDNIVAISDDVFSRLEALDNDESIKVDDSVFDAAEEHQPDVPASAFERQPTDVAPAQERPVSREESQRRTEPVSPTASTEEQEQAVEDAQKPFGDVPETDNSKAWNSQVTESGYGNEHRPWFKIAADQLEKTRQQPGYKPNEPFGLIRGFDGEGRTIRTKLKKTEKQWQALIKRQEAIWNYFNRLGVFDHLNEGNVKAGENPDKLRFATHKTLNDAAGCTVILLVDENGRVVGCLPDKAERRSIATLQDALQEDWNKVPEDERNAIHIFDGDKYSTHVATRYMGGPLYMYTEITDEDGKVIGEQQEQRLLNDVADDSTEPLVIGVVTDENTVTTSDSNVNMDNTIRSGSKPGTPVVLIKSKGDVHDKKQYTTAPIATPWFSTEMTKIAGLVNAVIHKAINELVSGQAEEGEFAAFAMLKDILNLGGVDFNKDNSGKVYVHIHFNKMTGRDSSGKPVYQRQEVRGQIRPDAVEEDIDAFIQRLEENQVGVNVSAKWLKPDKFKTAMDSLTEWNKDKYGDKPTDYVRLIGSIVYTNVGDLTTHSEWFDVNPVVKQGDKFVEVTKEQLATSSPQATTRVPQTKPVTPQQVRAAQSDVEAEIQEELAAIVHFAEGATEQERKRDLYNMLINAFGSVFARSQLGIQIAAALSTLEDGETLNLTNFAWRKVVEAWTAQATRDAELRFAREKSGGVYDSGVSFDESKHEYTLRETGKKLKGITSTLLKKLSDALYGKVPQEVLDKAKARGSKVHRFIEKCDRCRDIGKIDTNELSSMAAMYHAYRNVLRDAGLHVMMNEYTVTDGVEFASNIDLVLVDNDGNIVLGDIKTTADPRDAETKQKQTVYVAKQLAIYRNMFKYQNPGTAVSSRAVVVHINNNRIELEWIELEDEQVTEDFMNEYRDENGLQHPQPLQRGSDELTFPMLMVKADGEERQQGEEQAPAAEQSQPEQQPATEQPASAPANPLGGNPLPSQQSLYDRFTDQFGYDAVSEEEFNSVFKAGTLQYIDSNGDYHIGPEAFQAFFDDVTQGNDILEQTGLLSEVKDSQSLPERMDTDKELGWLKRALPNMSNEQHLKILETLIKLGNDRAAYGMLSKGVIYLYRYGAQGTVYHEAFHAVTQGLLTDKELLELYRAAREKWGDLPIVELEEKLADGFQKYMIEREYYKGPGKSIFRKLLDWIKGWFEKKDVIDALYQNINNGKYGSRMVKTSSNVFSSINNQQIAENRYRLANSMSSEERTALKRAGVNKREFDAMTAAQKYSMKHCLV
jgi:hypothetical protein